MKLKNTIAISLIALFLSTGIANASAWCIAASPHYSSGVVYGHDIHQACEKALRNCVAHTDHHSYCSVVNSGH